MSGSTSVPMVRAISPSDGGVSERPLKASSSDGAADGVLERRGERIDLLLAPALAAVGADHEVHHHVLQRLPAVERIAVVAGEEEAVVLGEVRTYIDRCRELPEQGRHRLVGDAGEGRKSRSGRSSTIRSSRTSPPVTPLQLIGDPLGPISPNLTGTTSGALVGWFGVGFCLLAEGQRVGLGRLVVASATVTSGVPACRYQVLNCSRSTPLASAKQSRNASIVVAPPSWRSK